MKIQLALVLFLSGSSGIALGQTACPSGVAAGSAQCGPSPASHGIAPAPSVQPQIRYVPTGKWIKTWGAIAIDAAVGDIGASVGEFSEHDAKQDALQRCEKHGAKECKFMLSFENQCAVIAWPSTKKGSGVVAAGGPDIDSASRTALPKCEGSDGECRIIYSDCSEPVFEEF